MSPLARTTPRTAVLVAAAASGVLLAGVSVAVADTTNAEVRACVQKSNGALFIPTSSACPNNSTPLSWNIQGPAGPAGPTGPAGDVGPQGPTGPGVTYRNQTGSVAFGAGSVGLALSVGCNAGETSISAGFSFAGGSWDHIRVVESRKPSVQGWNFNFRLDDGLTADDQTRVDYNLLCAS